MRHVDILHDKAQFLRLSLPGPHKVSITVQAPGHLCRLLEISLIGWSYDIIPFSEKSDIIVTQSKRYCIESHTTHDLKSYSDLISTINLIINEISYIVSSKIAGSTLIHCAAVKNSLGSILIFGDHKSGKSIYCAERSLDTDQCMADDLLIMLPDTNQFLTLGFPIRLRRPVPEKIISKVCGKHVLTGTSLCYLTSKTSNIASGGQTFSPVKAYWIDKNRELLEIKKENIVNYTTRFSVYMQQSR